MKKILISICIGVLLFAGIVVFYEKELKANSLENYEYTVKLFHDDILEEEIISFNIYKMEEIVNPNGIKQFVNQYESTNSFNELDTYIFESIYTNYTISINLDTLPEGYGVLNKRVYLSSESPYAEFVILKIDYVNIDENNEIRYYSKNNIEIFSTTINFSEEIVVNTLNINDSIEYINSDLEVASSPQQYDQKVDVGTFRIRYTSTQDEVKDENLATFATYIGNYFIEAYNFYITQLGFPKPIVDTETENNNTYDVIYLKNNTGNNLFTAFNGSTDGTFDVTDEKPGYATITIKINYDITSSLIFTEDMLDFLHSVCIHEYIHDIIYYYRTIDQFTHEMFASFLELYYVNYKGIKNYYIKKRFDDRIVNSEYFTANNEIFKVLSMDPSKNGYSASLFLIFLYEKIGNISFIDELFEEVSTKDNYELFENFSINNNMIFSEVVEEFGIFRVNPNKYITLIDEYYTENWSLKNKINNDNLTSVVSNSSQYNAKMEVYSWHCIEVIKSDMTLDEKLYITIQAVEGVKSYAIHERSDDELVIDELDFSNTTSITIETSALDLDNDNHLYIVMINSSNNIINNAYSYEYNFTTVKNNTPITLSDGLSINLDLNNTTLLQPIYSSGAGLYQIEIILDENQNIKFLENSLQVYFHNMSLINKHNRISGRLATSKENGNSIIVQLATVIDTQTGKYLPYYLRVGYYGSKINGIIKITKIREQESIISEETLTKSVELNNFLGDRFIHYDFDAIGKLMIDIAVNDIIDKEQKIYIINRNTKTSSNDIIDTYTMNENNSSLTIELDTEYYKNYVIILENGDGTKDIEIDLEFIFENDFSIILDPLGVSEALIGSEVRINNGSRNSNIITKGFTRSAFLNTEAPEESRLEYVWTSNNEEVVTVSQFGTITGIKPGFAIIQATYNDELIGQIIIEVIDDTNTTITNFTITTDMRQDSTVGSYVSSGKGVAGGTDLITSYTRLISLTTDAPSTIIQNYNWVSSDTSIATVSQFGTITGVSSGTVTITGTYKYNSRFTASIVITVL